jgi:cyclic 2,3-diphosphoglycerate synthetase
VSDLVCFTGTDDRQVAAVRDIADVPVIGADLVLRPVEPLGPEAVAVFTAGPAPVDHLDANVVASSQNLADRAHLRNDLASIDAETFLIEMKAAAIDVVAEAAKERGVRIVFARNDLVSREGEPDLDSALLGLADAALKEAVTV